MLIKQISLADVLPLRHEVLEFADAAETSILPGDSNESSLHFGCFIDERLVGVASLLSEGVNGNHDGGRRVRAMAITASLQKTGIGTALLRAMIDASSGADAPYVWCTVRPDALGFYTRFGFAPDGAAVEMPHGTFTRMVLRLQGKDSGELL